MIFKSTLENESMISIDFPKEMGILLEHVTSYNQVLKKCLLVISLEAQTIPVTEGMKGLCEN